MNASQDATPEAKAVACLERSNEEEDFERASLWTTEAQVWATLAVAAHLTSIANVLYLDREERELPPTKGKK